MSSHTLHLGVHALDPVSLTDLQTEAALLRRRDRKYLVPHEVVDAVLEGVAHETRVLEIDGMRTFRYESNYFDTPGLETYLAAARRRPSRFKVRTRAYMDSGTCALEVKVRDGRGLTVKHRMPYEFDERTLLTADALEYLADFDQVDAVKSELSRSLTTRYNRTTLLESASGSRITIDTGLTCIHRSGDFVGVPRVAVIETKSAGSPSRTDRLLWAMHYRPVKISKYCTGLAAIDHELPANKWHRVLQDHFTASATRSVNSATERRTHENKETSRHHCPTSSDVVAGRV